MLWQQAGAGELSAWESTPEGALALVIVLDQFPLNMYRGEALQFTTEAQARAVAGRAIEQGFDRQIPHERLAFLYLPYMHSESLVDQDRSVMLLSQAGMEQNLVFARGHREIVRRFGRFPHRIRYLGRDSSPEELVWLASYAGFDSLTRSKKNPATGAGLFAAERLFNLSFVPGSCGRRLSA